MKKLIEERNKKDEAKLMNAIHENYKKARMEMKMEEQLEEVAKNENQLSKIENLKKEKRANLILKFALVITVVSLIVLGIKFNEKEIANCMETGHSENFCRYAGE